MKTSFWSDFIPFFPPFSSLPFISPLTPIFIRRETASQFQLGGLGNIANTLRGTGADPPPKTHFSVFTI